MSHSNYNWIMNKQVLQIVRICTSWTPASMESSYIATLKALNWWFFWMSTFILGYRENNLLSITNVLTWLRHKETDTLTQCIVPSLMQSICRFKVRFHGSHARIEGLRIGTSCCICLLACRLSWVSVTNHETTISSESSSSSSNTENTERMHTLRESSNQRYPGLP